MKNNEEWLIAFFAGGALAALVRRWHRNGSAPPEQEVVQKRCSAEAVAKPPLSPADSRSECRAAARAGAVQQAFAMLCRRRSAACRSTCCGRRGIASLLIVAGFGAARTLLPEAGLRLLEQETAAASGSCIVARVPVVATPAQLPASMPQRHAALLTLLSQTQAPQKRGATLSARTFTADSRRARLVLGGRSIC